ncbi:hypothetical protein [Salinibacterium sp. TMP30]|uniref:hypothetical protein n=1 Tax=Salinibacterium sp. TMP30 TaxID=3138237 RepID=UPI003139CCB8
MFINPSPGSYATAKGRMFEAEAAIASVRNAEDGGGQILPRPVKPYSFTRGILFGLLTAPIAAAFVAVFGLNSPIAAVATTPIAMVVAFGLFAHGSGRTPVRGRGYAAATGIGIITMTVAIIISYPYSLFLTYLYDDGVGSILSTDFASHLSTWITTNPGQIFIPLTLVTIVTAVMLFRKARAARAHTVPARGK